MQFVGFPKIPRLNRECIITEKIDGTNAQVVVVPRTEVFSEDAPFIIADLGEYIIFAGSRTRFITPQADNFGFAAWVERNAEELHKLGPGQHFGEWWGGKVQRGYGLAEKRFSLFNVTRWNQIAKAAAEGHTTAFPACCHVVPTLYTGKFVTGVVDWYVNDLREQGSRAVPGYMNPEGVVVFHVASQEMYKVTLEGDGQPKSRAA